MDAGGVQVGRDHEHERLRSVLRDAAAGRPSALRKTGTGSRSELAELVRRSS